METWDTTDNNSRKLLYRYYWCIQIAYFLLDKNEFPYKTCKYSTFQLKSLQECNKNFWTV